MCQYNSVCTSNCTSTCVQDTCGCLSKYSGECIIYDGEELTCTSIAVGLNLNDLIKEIDSYFCIFRNEIMNFISILNLGTGAKVYRDDNLLGQKQLRSLVSTSSSLTISENTDEIAFEVQSASETLEGVIEIADQAEVDAGTDSLKAVTPSTLTTFTSNPANLPLATETTQGVAEIATQAEVNTGVDDERFVTPAKLNSYVTAELADPVNLPSATEVAQGIAEIATQAEVDLGTDDTRIVTPAKLSSNITSVIGTAIIPIGFIGMWAGSIGTIPMGWKLCDGTDGTPNLRGRFIVGYNVSDLDYNAIGNVGGSKEVVLTEAQLAQHSHTGTTAPEGDHAHTVNAPERENESVDNGGGTVTQNNSTLDAVTNTTGEHIHVITMDNTGNNEAHENRPPYYTLAYIQYQG